MPDDAEIESAASRASWRGKKSRPDWDTKPDKTGMFLQKSKLPKTKEAERYRDEIHQRVETRRDRGKNEKPFATRSDASSSLFDMTIPFKDKEAASGTSVSEQHSASSSTRRGPAKSRKRRDDVGPAGELPYAPTMGPIAAGTLQVMSPGRIEIVNHHYLNPVLHQHRSAGTGGGGTASGKNEEKRREDPGWMPLALPSSVDGASTFRQTGNMYGLGPTGPMRSINDYADERWDRWQNF